MVSFIGSLILLCSCNSNESRKDIPPANEVDYWLTTGDRSSLLALQPGVLTFDTSDNSYPVVTVDTSQRFQYIDGFGYTLTGGSSLVISRMQPAARDSLLQELFGSGANGIHINYLRISIGASDLSHLVYTYDDLPAGQTDPLLHHFNLRAEYDTGTALIPLLKEILKINPGLKILATPWTAPSWMKTNGSSIGGSLKPVYYSVYAQYFVKYIQQMLEEGIRIDAITPQNEPLHPGNNPSMVMTAVQQADFIKNHLGPAFSSSGIATKIIVYDHNCDHPDYPLTILKDSAARKFVNGSAFHLYAGDIDVLSSVHNAYPDKQIYFTEQYNSKDGVFGTDLQWHMKNVVIGSMRNFSRTALIWNLANDRNYGPFTPGGCNTCLGALTIDSSVTRNVSYYVIAHASKFVPPGSVRVASNNTDSLYNVAFETPMGKTVLIVLNEAATPASFNIKQKEKWVTVTLPGRAVSTFVW